MEFLIKNQAPATQKSVCIIALVFENKKLSNCAKQLDAISNGAIQKIIKKGDVDGTRGQAILLYDIPNIKAERILLIGVGKETEFNEKQFIETNKKIFACLNEKHITEAIFPIDDFTLDLRSTAWKIKQSILTHNAGTYCFNKYKSNPEPVTQTLEKIVFITEIKKELKQAEHAIEHALAIAKGINLTKNLANTPPNICTPTFLAKEAQTLAKTYKKVNVAILNQKEMHALKMGSLLSVAESSKNEAKLITLEYRGAQSHIKPIIFIGKGITFDTGGNSLKTPVGMIGMKYDMCGAATVLGLILIAAELKLPLNIVGILAAAENMPGKDASRPDDIVTSMSGTTIEILNTDAEGRLVLCDALTYAKRFDPEVVIDIATLTSACVIALGRFHSGLFSNHEPLAQDLLTAGKEILDPCWQLPIGPDYKEQLKSNFADLANVGGPEAGSITAACFLSHFAEEFNWAHLDIAGTSSVLTGADRGSTGKPIPLLAQYLLNKC